MSTRRFVEIPSLDGLRAVSISIVFIAHLGYDKIVPGGFGVTVFFVLSGYLITTLLRLERESSGSVSIGNFYLRRAFRILPAFYFVLLAAMVASWLGLVAGTVDPLPTMSQALHFWNYFAIFYKGSQQPIPGTGVYWSLAVEEHFYLLFPLTFFLLCRRGLDYRKQGIVLACASAGILAWRCLLVFGFHVSVDRTYLGTDTRADSLMIGCAIALAFNPALGEVRASSRRLAGWAVAGVVMILGSLAFRDDRFRETFRYTIQSVSIGLIMVYLISYPKQWAPRILNTRPVVWFGKLSYPFYLVHYVVLLELLRHIHGRLVLGVASFALSVAIAAAVQAAVMEPMARVGRRMLSRRSQAPAASVASA